MSANAEDLARLIVSIELSQAKVEKQAAAIAKSAERAANKIDGDFARANDNVAKSFQRASKSSAVSVGQTRAAVTNLSFQLNDIAQGLASGTSPFTIMVQQGSQVSQALGSAGGGAIGAVRALGGAFATMVNPVTLATFAIIGLGGAAIQYFTQMLSDSEDSEKTLKEQAELIDKVAQKWGDALPALKAYNDERKKLQDEADIKDAVDAAVSGEFSGLRKIVKDVNVDLAELIAKLQAAGTSDSDVVKLQVAFAKLFDDVAKGKDGVDHLKQVQAALTALYEKSHIPAAKEMADAIGRLADEFERAAEAGQKLKADAALQDFYKNSPLGTLSPLTSGGGRFLNPAEQQDFTANGTKSQFEVELEKASGAIDSFVDHVVKAESGGNNNAKNPNSTATGAGQFIESTWLDLFERYFPDRAEGMTRGAILALRADGNVSRSLIEAYAKENAAILQAAGVHVDEAALQLAHFLGAGDAAKVLTAASGTPLAGLISQRSINANPSILGGGATVNDAISYANNRASASTASPSRPKMTPEGVFAGDVNQIQARIDLLNAEYTAQSQLNPAIDDYGFAVEKARIKQQLLNEAKKAGVEITPELAAKIDTLAGNYAAAATAGDKLKASQEKLSQAMQESAALGKDVLGGFIQDLRDGKTASEALANALNKVADKLLEVALNAIFDGGGGGFFGAIASAFGFASGGYTGPGGKNQPAGIVHKGEVVYSQDDVRRHGGVKAVETMRKGNSNGLLAGIGMGDRDVGGSPMALMSLMQRLLSAPSLARSHGRSGGEENVRVVVGVSADNNGNLLPFVESVSQDSVRRAAPGIVRASVQEGQKVTKRNMGGMIANAQTRTL
ncbi:phage tail length tape measure family protein [Mesorhizobium sp. M0118]|uniref:phage tail length tape measure family protein n=1 Tax=Mesorhizobium sp. M0118 TaxID=2956884 RepID=UPI00333781DF